MFRKQSNEKSSNVRAGLSTLLGVRPVAPLREPAPLPVRVGVIGRGHAGKTAIFRTMAKGPLTDFLPSGLQVDLDDPLELAAALQQMSVTLRDLQLDGIGQTLDTPEIRYYLLEGERKRVVFQTREVVGQILTHTTKASSPEQLERYKRYVADLAAAHVLWAVIPCPPPRATAADHDRYADDLKITASYVRQALRLRTDDRPCSVAILMTKVDTLFPSAAEARQKLTDGALREALAPMVHTVSSSDKVSDAAILPVSAFGFGNAVLKQDDDDDDEVEVNPPRPAEPEWIIRPGGTPEPFNFSSLVVWSLLHGLMNQEVDVDGDDEPALARVCRLLSDDLDVLGGWFVPIKGRLARAPRSR